MKMKFTPLLLLLCFRTIAQTGNAAEDGGELITGNNAQSPCITEQQYQEVEKRCNDNARLNGLVGQAALYIKNNGSRGTQSTLLNWPLKAATGYTDCSFYYISAHVDEDSSASTFKDYQCGTTTYNGHRGTDIAIGPFPFYKMDKSQVEVIAAAAGTILDKHDGEFDRQCLSAGSNVTANYIIVQHADGSRCMYWHMKKNSLTSKAIGQTVTQGEYLGVVGSSGSSGGPHLHFEVWAGNTVATLVDPFSGSCNHFNGASWWAVQKPYTEPAVIKASVHTTDYTAPANCGTTETTNESTSYTIPFQGAGLSPGYAKFYIFLRNETPSTTVTMSILNPNSTVYSTWSRSLTNTYKLSYYGYSKLLPTTPGTYTFQAVYNGITCSQTFDIVTTTGITETSPLVTARVYPNPSNGKFMVELETGKALEQGAIEIYNVTGVKIYETEIATAKTEVQLNTPAGFYFYRIKNKQQFFAEGKLVME